MSSTTTLSIHSSPISHGIWWKKKRIRDTLRFFPLILLGPTLRILEVRLYTWNWIIVRAVNWKSTLVTARHDLNEQKVIKNWSIYLMLFFSTLKSTSGIPQASSSNRCGVSSENRGRGTRADIPSRTHWICKKIHGLFILQALFILFLGFLRKHKIDFKFTLHKIQVLLSGGHIMQTEGYFRSLVSCKANST